MYLEEVEKFAENEDIVPNPADANKHTYSLHTRVLLPALAMI